MHDLIDQVIPLQYRHLVHQLVHENPEFYNSLVQMLLEHMRLVEPCTVEVMPTTCIQEAAVMSTLKHVQQGENVRLSSGE